MPSTCRYNAKFTWDSVDCKGNEAADEAAFGVDCLCCILALRKIMAKEYQVRPVQLCVFDTERDYPEGEEAQQILAYHPEACSITDQTSIVGLAQALLTFNANFEEARIQLTLAYVTFVKARNFLHCRKLCVTACMLSDVCGPSTDLSHTSCC